ncbi:MAG: DUF4902 domain-containing protein [Methylotenera sp.]
MKAIGHGVHNQSNMQKFQCNFTSKVNLSADGYIRLTLETLSSIPLVHLLSGIDLDNSDIFQEGASLASVSGYTEWVSTTMPVITIGWDWGLDTLQGSPVCRRIETPRSNIMVIDSITLQDLGYIKSLELLETLIANFKWQEEVTRYIALRYS